VVETRFGDDRLLSGGPGDDVLMGGAGDRPPRRGRPGDDLLGGGPGTTAWTAATATTCSLRRLGPGERPAGVGGRAPTRWSTWARGRWRAGAGDDTLWGARAETSPRLIGGDGDDVLFAGPNVRLVDCGDGRDVVLLSAEALAVRAAGRLPALGRLRGLRAGGRGPDDARAPRFASFEERYVALGVPWDDDVVGLALAYESRTSCLKRRSACRPSNRDQRIVGTDRADRFSGGGGDDLLEGAGGSDRLSGDRGRDLLFGRTGNDTLRGGLGSDEIEGGRGNDTLYGQDGDDRIAGGFGPDRIFGGGGNDTIRTVGGSRDVVDCGPGRDRIEKDSRDRTRNCEVVL
jgi:Ca2+-binding RTX toxin-like protein